MLDSEAYSGAKALGCIFAGTLLVMLLCCSSYEPDSSASLVIAVDVRCVSNIDFDHLVAASYVETKHPGGKSLSFAGCVLAGTVAERASVGKLAPAINCSGHIA